MSPALWLFLSSTCFYIQSIQSSLSRQLVFVCRTNFAEQITSHAHLFVTNTILIACFHYNYIHKYNQNSNSDYMRVRALPYRRSSRRSSRYPFIWCDILISSRYLIIWCDISWSQDIKWYDILSLTWSNLTIYCHILIFKPIRIFFINSSSSTTMGSSLSRSVKTVSTTRTFFSVSDFLISKWFLGQKRWQRECGNFSFSWNRVSIFAWYCCN